jgi:hypothetical protein
MVPLGGVAQVVEDNSGLHAGDAPRRINFEDFVHVPGKIENHGHIAALPRERRSGAAAEKRSAKFAGQRNGSGNIVCVVGKNNSNGDLSVVGSVGRVKRAAAVIEAHIATDGAAKRHLQSNRIHDCGFSGRRAGGKSSQVSDRNV